MADGRLEKMEVDYSSTVDELLPQVKTLALEGKLETALEQCVALEKQTRTSSDAISTGRLLETMVELLADAKQWGKLNDHLLLMTKKRGQLKQAVTRMVKKAMVYLEDMPDKETKVALIAALRNVTEGKIYVEVERARLTRELAGIREEEGNIEEAAAVLHDLQVETFGSMEKKEKVEFILEQMRLGLARKDFIRTQIISRKISTRFFQEEGTEELKLKYYKLMTELDSHENAYLSISKHYWEVYNTKSIQEDEEQRLMALKHVVVYLLLAPYDNEQHDLMCRRKDIKDMEKIQAYLDMLKAFTKQELLRWDEFCARFETILRTETAIFVAQTEESVDNQKRWKDLHSRVIEHNIRVIAAYYTQIRLKRLAELLDLDADQAEEHLSTLVVKKTIHAKIDRLEAVIHFTENKMPTDILNDWSYTTKSLMSLINKTTHLISKERMIHGV